MTEAGNISIIIFNTRLFCFSFKISPANIQLNYVYMITINKIMMALSKFVILCSCLIAVAFAAQLVDKQQMQENLRSRGIY